MIKMGMMALFAILVSRFVSTAGETSDYKALEETDVSLRVPFRELIQCLDTSDMEEQWLNSTDDLHLGVTFEMDEYLRNNLASAGYLRSENVRVKLHEPTVVANVETDEPLRSFLRQRVSENKLCHLDLELIGEVLFTTGLESYNPLEANLPEDDGFYPVTRRISIYDQVLQSLTEGHRELLLSPDNNTATLTEHVSRRPRKLQSMCVDVIQAKYVFRPDEFMCSGPFSFGLSSDGDLGIWNGWTKVWSAGTCCGAILALQPDGNLVVRDKEEVPLWDSETNGDRDSGGEVQISDNGVVSITNANANRNLKITPSLDDLEDCITELKGKDKLNQGERICSAGGRYSFGLSSDGDLGIWEGPKQVWSADTCCKGDGTYARLQVDGNFVVRAGDDTVLWESITSSIEMADPVVTVSPTGIVSIINVNAGKKVTIEPYGDRQPPVEDVPVVPTGQPCVEQVTGRIDLHAGDFICSPNGPYRFGTTLSGDLQLLDNDKIIWSAGTCCAKDDNFAVLQRSDGNLVVRTDSGTRLWSAGSGDPEENANSSLSLNDSGTVAITNPAGKRTWVVAPGNVPSPSPRAPVPSPTKPPTPMPVLIPTPAPIFKAPPIDPSLYPCRAPVVGKVVLEEGDFLCSSNKQVKFGLTVEGELTLLDRGRRVWSANTCCTGEAVTARLQIDANLVVATTGSNKILWTSETSDPNADVASLMVGDDGIVTITDSIMGHIWSSAVSRAERVVPNDLRQKVMAGYQGWFYAKGDGGLNKWNHWTKRHAFPDKNTITIDAWPDMRELDDDELYPTGFTYKDGSNAGLYSAYNTKTVERHTKWMKDYGIDGVFVQRFIGTAMAWTPIEDKVLQNVRSGSEKYGRTFVNMYDIGNGDDENIVQDVINDWKHLVDNQNITKSKQYLHHRGRPLVAIWGFGFYDRLGTPTQVKQIIDWFKNKAEDKYKATLMGGVPAGWRDLSRDSKTAASWASVYRSYDVISPWTVGRYNDVGSANYFRRKYIEPDLAECNSLGIDYLPVAFPGFSFNNLKPEKPFNEIPRLGGTFMWHQFYNIAAAGSKMIYVAMFDEVDEGTAIFKIAPNRQQTPVEGRFLTSGWDNGYGKTPGDWYLNITGTVAGLLHKGKDVPLNMPALP